MYVTIYQAVRWHRGLGHRRTDLLAAPQSLSPEGSLSLDRPSSVDGNTGELTFVQKLEKKKRLKRATQGTEKLLLLTLAVESDSNRHVNIQAIRPETRPASRVKIQSRQQP